MRAVPLDDRLHVHGGHHVTVEDDQRVANAVGRITNRAAGAERSGLDDVAHAHAGAGAITEDLLDAARLVVEAEDHLVDLGHLLQQIDLIVEKRPVEDRHDGLGRVNRERPEARALAPGQQNRLHDKLRSYTAFADRLTESGLRADA